MDTAAEHERIYQAQRDLPPGVSSDVIVTHETGGVRLLTVNRDCDTGRTAALSFHLPRAETIELIQALAENAGLPDPWNGRTIR